MASNCSTCSKCADALKGDKVLVCWQCYDQNKIDETNLPPYIVGSLKCAYCSRLGDAVKTVTKPYCWDCLDNLEHRRQFKRQINEISKELFSTFNLKTELNRLQLFICDDCQRPKSKYDMHDKYEGNPICGNCCIAYK